MVIQIPGRWLSAEHLRIVRDGQGGWVVEDAGSKNETFVDGSRITRAPIVGT